MPTALMKRLWLVAGAGAISVLLGIALIGSRQAPGEGEAVQAGAPMEQSQPIQFPHDTHAGQFLIDCQYCHYSAERSVDAGIPPVETCIGCHREGLIDGRNIPEEIVKVREHYDSGSRNSVAAHLQGLRSRALPAHAARCGRGLLPDLPRPGAGDGRARGDGPGGGEPEDGLVHFLPPGARGFPRLHGMPLLAAAGIGPRRIRPNAGGRAFRHMRPAAGAAIR